MTAITDLHNGLQSLGVDAPRHVQGGDDIAARAVQAHRIQSRMGRDQLGKKICDGLIDKAHDPDRGTVDLDGAIFDRMAVRRQCH